MLRGILAAGSRLDYLIRTLKAFGQMQMGWSVGEGAVAALLARSSCSRPDFGFIAL